MALASKKDKQRMPAVMPGSFKVAIVGGGPAGLLAAQRLGLAGAEVEIFEQMRTPGLKFLIAGRGGLNLTHSEPFEQFASRYGGSCDKAMRDILHDFGPQEMRAWANGLGVETFVGSSRRVFPAPPLMDKAAPVLRMWLTRLEELGVKMHTEHRWNGFVATGENGAIRHPPALLIQDSKGQDRIVEADAVLLALGGASWAKLGSDGKWVGELAEMGVSIAKLRPNNVGFKVPWSSEYASRYAGTPVKDVRLSFDGHTAQGDLMITKEGIEGGAVCALSSRIISSQGCTAVAPVLHIDLRPNMQHEVLAKRLSNPSLRKASFSSKLRKALKVPPVAAGLIRHTVGSETDILRDPERLAGLVKDVPLELGPCHGFESAISTSGGVAACAFQEGTLMLRALPGVFVAGEMMDWEAPTGGYLLTGTFASAHSAASDILAWGARQGEPDMDSLEMV